MPRWWHKGTALSALLLTILGCTGQQLSGAWRGPFPLRKADDCRLRLDSGRFDLSCRSQGERAERWLGAGTYAQDRDTITFAFTALAEDGRPLRDQPTLELAYQGQGNRLQLQTGTWKGEWRRMWR